MITEHIIKSSQGILFTGSYDAVIDWLNSNRSWVLFDMDTDYTKIDVPSKMIILYKVKKRD